MCSRHWKPADAEVAVSPCENLRRLVFVVVDPHVETPIAPTDVNWKLQGVHNHLLKAAHVAKRFVPLCDVLRTRLCEVVNIRW